MFLLAADVGTGVKKPPRHTLKIDAIDHVVLTVQDVQTTSHFYQQVLGMRVVHFERCRTALKFGTQKINLHKAGNEFAPKASRPTRGSADICLITSERLPDWEQHLKKCGVTVIEGPIWQTGARGVMQSIYLRDPDGNLIEISKYE